MTDIEQIKAKIDAVSFIGEYVILKKAGANFKGLCPFHNEKTPSFMVSPERQIWHCFGGCNEGGDIFKFLMKAENLEFPEALKILAKRAGVKLTESFQTSKTSELRERLFAINHLASEFYNYILTSHPLGAKAREYIGSRKITDSSVKLFGIGYSPNSWDSLLKFLLKKGYKEEDILAAGLAGKSSIGHTYDKFRGRLMFTIRDHRGNVVGFTGRLLDPNAKEQKYVNTNETPVYTKGDILYGLETTKEEIKKAGFVVAVEGQMDMISSYQAGVRNVVAISGTALTAGHIMLLKRYTENIYLSLDADSAGDAAMHKSIEIADAAGLNIKVVRIPGATPGGGQAKDPDELIREGAEGISQWHEAVKNAVSFYDFVIDSAVEKFQPETSEGAKKIVSEVAKFIGAIDNLVVKAHYLRKMSQILGLPQEALEEQIDKELRKSRVGVGEGKDTNKLKTLRPREEVVEEALISLILQSQKPSDYLILLGQRLTAEDFTNPVTGKIYQLLWTFCGSPKSDVGIPEEKFDIRTFVTLVPPEILATVDRLFLQENNVNPRDESEMLQATQKMAWDIKELSLRQRLRLLSTEIQKKPEENSDLNQDFAQMTSQLQKLLEEKSLLEVKS